VGRDGDAGLRLEQAATTGCSPDRAPFDLAGFLRCVLATGYTGPLSLEVFNDVFRLSDPWRTAVDAMRSLVWLEEAAARVWTESCLVLPPAAPHLSGHSFTELAVDGISGPRVAEVLSSLGFTHTGQHRSKPVQLWEQGEARVLLNASVTRPSGAGVAAIAALGLESDDPAGSAARAEACKAPVLPRARGASEAELSAIAAPDSTVVFFTRASPDGWPSDFLATGEPTSPGAGITRVDHVGLTQPFDSFDEAGLFYRAVLGLDVATVAEVAAPYGLIRTRAVKAEDRKVRLTLSVSALRRGGWSPTVPDPQSLALATDDIVATARVLRDCGAPLLAVPANYADDLEARYDLAPGLLEAIREFGLMYDGEGRGAYLHLVTEVFGGRVFFEVVQRLDGYDGYGTPDVPVRMAAHRRARTKGAATEER
jgi:4-hydroxyphenylpyruvate dioxygenase